MIGASAETVLSEVCGQTSIEIFLPAARMKDSGTDNTPLAPGVAGILEGARIFEEYRAKIAASLPSGSSNEERKRLVFEKVYGADGTFSEWEDD